MGVCFSKKKLNYSRNEIMALNREANLYGINLKRYQEFSDTNNYKLAVLSIASNYNYDEKLIQTWNEWKRLQPWGLNKKDLDKNCLTQLAYAPTRLNNSTWCPKTHDTNHINTLLKFYSLYFPSNNLELMITTKLDKYRYHEIIDDIKNKYGEPNWKISQNLNQKWLDVIATIKTSSHQDIKYLELIEEFCKTQTSELLDNLNKKFII